MALRVSTQPKPEQLTAFVALARPGPQATVVTQTQQLAQMLLGRPVERLADVYEEFYSRVLELDVSLSSREKIMQAFTLALNIQLDVQAPVNFHTQTFNNLQSAFHEMIGKQLTSLPTENEIANDGGNLEEAELEDAGTPAPAVEEELEQPEEPTELAPQDGSLVESWSALTRAPKETNSAAAARATATDEQADASAPAVEEGVEQPEEQTGSAPQDDSLVDSLAALTLASEVATGAAASAETVVTELSPLEQERARLETIAQQVRTVIQEKWGTDRPHSVRLVDNLLNVPPAAEFKSQTVKIAIQTAISTVIEAIEAASPAQEAIQKLEKRIQKVIAEKKEPAEEKGRLKQLETQLNTFLSKLDFLRDQSTPITTDQAAEIRTLRQAIRTATTAAGVEEYKASQQVQVEQALEQFESRKEWLNTLKEVFETLNNRVKNKLISQCDRKLQEADQALDALKQEIEQIRTAPPTPEIAKLIALMQNKDLS